jgi:hypothetical protein
MRMIRRLRRLSFVLLVCFASTTAEAQTELLWQHADGRLGVWTMEDTKSLSGDPLGPGQVADPLWRISAEGDFNGDNLRDIVFQHQGDGRLAVWLMNDRSQTSGVALSPAQVPDLNWKVRGAGDFNGDFHPDLIWQNEVTGQIAAWLMEGTTRPDGNGRLLSPSVVEDTDWRIVGVADFDRDGRSDLLWQHEISGLFSVWHMNGLSRIDGTVLWPYEYESPDPNVKLRAVGDVNGDRWPDLIWQNQVTGRLSAWLMRDGQRLGEVLLSPDHVADTNWRIVGIRHPWDYSGIYTLTIAAGSCSPGFPEELKRRVYTARVEQTAANLRVSVSGDFLVTADGAAFYGAVSPTGEIGFFLGSAFDSVFGVTERLSDGTALMMFGTISATGTPAGIFPTHGSEVFALGEMFHYPPWSSVFYPYSFTGWCFMDRFEMVPQ